MKKSIIVSIALISSLVVIAVLFFELVGTSNKSKKQMIITSPSFEDGSGIPKKYTCDGENINPELQVQNVPASAKSLALIVDDPDAPSGAFTHWVVFNIPPETRVIKEQIKPPSSVEGLNSAGHIGYMGPCPPAGSHRYRFHLFALDAMLGLSQDSSADDLRAAMAGHILEDFVLTGTYSR